MDKKIEKKGPSMRRGVVIGAAALLMALIAWQVVSRASSSRLSVDSTRITTGLVKRALFREFYPSDGTVQPATSVYLDVEEGGRVDEILVEGGQQVQKGDLILRFSNATL